MHHWKSNNGYRVFWYNHKNYKHNIDRTVKGSGSYVVFSDWCSDETKINLTSVFLVGEDFDILPYKDNFIKDIPQKAVLYFDKNAQYPKAKFEIAEFKRTLKPEKADAIVLQSSAIVTCSIYSYLVFTDSMYIYAINDQWLKKDFNDDVEALINDKDLGMSFHGPITVLFHGRLQGISDPADTLKKFNSVEYNKPFILTIDLDRIINQNLPDLDLQSMNAIYEMIVSTDSSIVKLGAVMASTFNVNKWQLSATVLMYQNTNWFYYSSTALKQLRRTLGLVRCTPGWSSIASEIQSNRKEYSKEDILLAQNFVKDKPGFKEFCEQNKGFYLDFLPYIPDEYKH